MSNYHNQLTKPRQNDYRDKLIESERLKLKKMKQEELESNRRLVSSYYAGVNPND